MEKKEKNRKDEIYLGIITLIIGVTIIIGSLIAYFNETDKVVYLLIWAITGAVCLLMLGAFEILKNIKKKEKENK